MTHQTEALAELVALDDLKRSLAQASHHAQMHPSDENYAVIDAIQTDLHRRQKPAWDAARAAISSQHPAPEEAAALPANELASEEGWLPVNDGKAGEPFVAYADWNMRPGLASGWKWAKVRRVTSIAWETATLAQGTTPAAMVGVGGVVYSQGSDGRYRNTYQAWVGEQATGVDVLNDIANATESWMCEAGARQMRSLASDALLSPKPAQAEPMSDETIVRVFNGYSSLIDFYKDRGINFARAILAEAGIKEKTNG